jgi:hypothetical protein
MAGPASPCLTAAERLFAETIGHVPQGQHWMAIEHPGTGISHHSPDLLSLLRLVAVDGAFCAGGLALLEGAFLEALPGIRAQSLALCTQAVQRCMQAVAVEIDHRLNSPVFSGHPAVVIGH